MHNGLQEEKLKDKSEGDDNNRIEMAVQEAGIISGVSASRIIKEPTASAIDCGMDKKSSGARNVHTGAQVSVLKGKGAHQGPGPPLLDVAPQAPQKRAYELSGNAASIIESCPSGLL